MSVKEIHQYKEFNDFTGKSGAARKHSVKFKDKTTNTVSGVAKTMKVATLVSIVGIGVATAAIQIEEPIVDFSGMQVYMEEQPKWLSDKPTFNELFMDHVHDWDEGIILVEATCTEAGSIEFSCNGCEEKKTESIDAKGHTIVTTEGLEATCMENGYTKSEECSVCGEVLVKAQVVAAKGHVEKIVEAVEATCTEKGHTAGKICEVCGEGLENTKVTKALGHKYGKPKTTKEATCTEQGEEQKVCSRCGETENAIIPVTDHKFGEREVIKSATCTEDGEERTTCSGCGKIENFIAKATGHSFGKSKVTKSATCTEDGSSEQTCSGCGEKITEIIKATGHKEQKISGKSATCLENGRTEGSKCSECGTVFAESTTIPALGHDIEYKAAPPMDVETSPGGYPVCKRCGENLCKHEDVIEDGDSWDPYCYEEGHVAGTFCYFCGKVFSTGYDIPATGHTAGDGYVYIIDEPTCRSTGTGTTVCLNCGDEFEVELPIDPDYHPSDGRELEYGDPSNPEMPTGAHCKYCGASVPW